MSSSGSRSLQNNVHKRLLPVVKRRTLSACIAAFSGVVLGSFSSLALSLGLGELDSTSYLGQPLKAKIELVSLEGDIDLNSLIVRQVTAEEAQKMGVETFYAPYRIDFIVDTSSGAPRILVTSSEPIHEPYLNLMVELRWPKGVVYRDYPLLLDPPPVVTVRSAPRAAPAPAMPVARPAEAVPVRPSVPTPRPVQLKLEPLVTEEGKYKVQRGDTLSAIAERWREGTTQSRTDTMQWLHENNEHAFADNNINRLRAGAVLQMPDLSAYRAAEDGARPGPPSIAPLPQVGSGEKEMAKVSADESAQARSGTGDDGVISTEARGLLTLGSDSRDDKTRELIDMLVRENETLKARMEKIESSEYLDTLKQLIVLQRQQISDLRQKIGAPDTDANQEMDELFREIGVSRTAVAQAQKAPEPLPEESTAIAAAPVVESQAEHPEAVLKVEPVVAQPVQKDTGRSWLVWLMFGVGLALSGLFIAMFAYYRRMVPARQRDREPDVEHLTAVLDAHEPRAEPTINTFKPRFEEQQPPVQLDYDGEVTPIYLHKKKNENNWLGEKADSSIAELDDTVREIQEAFEDMVLDEEALKNLDSVEEISLNDIAVDTPAEMDSGKPAAPVTTAPVATTLEKPQKKGKKDQVSRRPDEEVRMSIAEKMAQYNPDEYRQEMESLELLELDELNEIEASDEEDVETIVYRAMMFCEFKKFDKARNLVELKMQGIQDARLDAALVQIDSLENEARKSSKKAI